MNWTQATTRAHFSPQSVGTIHFVGIGGIGMSGIAEILHSSFRIAGESDSGLPNSPQFAIR